MALFLGKAGRKILNNVVSSPKLNKVANTCGEKVFCKIDPGYSTGITRLGYLLAQEATAGDELSITNSAVKLNGGILDLKGIRVDSTLDLNISFDEKDLTPEKITNVLRQSSIEKLPLSPLLLRLHPKTFMYSWMGSSCVIGGLDLFSREMLHLLPSYLTFLEGHMGDFIFPTFMALSLIFMFTSQKTKAIDPFLNNNMRKKILGLSLLSILLCINREISGGDFHPTPEMYQESNGAVWAADSTFDWWDIALYIIGGSLGLFIGKNCVDYQDTSVKNFSYLRYPLKGAWEVVDSMFWTARVTLSRLHKDFISK